MVIPAHKSGAAFSRGVSAGTLIVECASEQKVCVCVCGRGGGLAGVRERGSGRHLDAEVLIDHHLIRITAGSGHAVGAGSAVLSHTTVGELPSHTQTHARTHVRILLVSPP